MTLAEDTRVFYPALRSAARKRRLVNGQGWAAVFDGDWVVELSAVVESVRPEDGRRRIRATLRAKPRVVDDILWTTMALQDEISGAVMRRNRRIDGVFCVAAPAIRTLDFWMQPLSSAEADDVARVFLDELARGDREFRAATPDLATYLADTTRRIDTETHGHDWQRVLQATTMIAIGDHAAAVRLAREQIAAGNHGGMSGPGGSVWHMLVRDFERNEGAFAPGYVPRLD